MAELNVDVFDIFASQWALLTAGNEKSYNTMTIGWGGLGTLWSKPVATVYVKPVRYTYKFMEESDFFTVSFYKDEYKKQLGILGTKSGRDCDKVALSGFTPKIIGEFVSFEEAHTTLLCKKIYFQDMLSENMPADVVDKYYLTEEPHRMYIGEVTKIIG